MVEPIKPTRNDIQPMNAPLDHALDHWPRHMHDFRQTSELFALQLAESRSQAKDTVGTQLKCSAVISSRSIVFAAKQLHCISRTPSTPPLDVGYINQRTVIFLSITRDFPESSSIISCPDPTSLRRRASKRRKEGESSGNMSSSYINKRWIVVQFVVPRSQNADNFLSETTWEGSPGMRLLWPLVARSIVPGQTATRIWILSPY
ncbi:uncharacterized protein ARMOST_18498 [Armillaria ostoyae]|uniref:Uncharacterized protein n=1 Tax=Armillaria ostoyae TaxID=47428 RepID=A0A284S229_ARMOS|nr:uncharacterized protein ARMOST_18498 [Armillaria ostoyae]